MWNFFKFIFAQAGEINEWPLAKRLEDPNLKKEVRDIIEFRIQSTNPTSKRKIITEIYSTYKPPDILEALQEIREAEVELIGDKIYKNFIQGKEAQLSSPEKIEEINKKIDGEVRQFAKIDENKNFNLVLVEGIHNTLKGYILAIAPTAKAFQNLQPDVQKEKIRLTNFQNFSKLSEDEKKQFIQDQLNFLRDHYPVPENWDWDAFFYKLSTTAPTQRNISRNDVLRYINKEYNLELQEVGQHKKTILEKTNINATIQDLKNVNFTLDPNQNPNGVDYFKPSINAIRYFSNKTIKDADIIKNSKNVIIQELIPIWRSKGGNYDEFLKYLTDIFGKPDDFFYTDVVQNVDENEKADDIYKGKNLDSNSERKIMEIVRGFGLSCVPSSAQIPSPDNEDYDFFKIDFVIYCHVLKAIQNQNVIQEMKLLIGEYYGFNDLIVREKKKNDYDINRDKFLTLIGEYNNLISQNNNVENAEELNKLLREIEVLKNKNNGRGSYAQRSGYSYKAEIKEKYEQFVASIIKADTISLTEANENNTLEKQLFDQLNAKNVIFKTKSDASNAYKDVVNARQPIPQKFDDYDASIAEATVYAQTLAIKDYVNKNEKKENFWSVFKRQQDSLLEPMNEKFINIFKILIQDLKNYVYIPGNENLKSDTSKILLFKKLLIEQFAKYVPDELLIETFIQDLNLIPVEPKGGYGFTLSQLNEGMKERIEKQVLIADELLKAKLDKLNQLKSCKGNFMNYSSRAEQLSELQIFSNRADSIAKLTKLDDVMKENPCYRRTAKQTFNYLKTGGTIVKENKIIMQEKRKIELMQNLIKLAQMAEMLEDENPKAANLIDESVEEMADNIPAPDTAAKEFPRVSNPEVKTTPAKSDLAVEVADEIFDEYEDLLLSDQISDEQIDRIIDKKLQEKS